MPAITDEQLCTLAKKGDLAARDKLVARYISVVSSRASAYRPVSGSFDRDDLGQEGFIGLISAIDSFDESYGASFSTFAVLNIDRRITDAVRRALRKRNVPDSAKVAADNLVDDSDPANAAIARDTLRRVIEGLNSRTSERERMVLMLHLSGYSHSEAASRLGCSLKAIEGALARVRRKLNHLK